MSMDSIYQSSATSSDISLFDQGSLSVSSASRANRSSSSSIQSTGTMFAENTIGGEIPNVVGMSRIDAINAINAAGYNFLITYTSSSADALNNDTVASQTEDSGTIYLQIYQYVQQQVTINYSFFNNANPTAPYAYDPDGLNGTVTGEAPLGGTAQSGSSFIVPGNPGGMQKIQMKANFINQGGGSYVRQMPDQIVYSVFRGWSDGDRYYVEGQTYTFPDHDVVFTAIWTNENIAPDVVSVSNDEPSVGETITLYGIGLANTIEVEVDRITAQFTVIDDDVITVVIPEGAGPGPMFVRNASGNSTFYYLDVI